MKTNQTNVNVSEADSEVPRKKMKITRTEEKVTDATTSSSSSSLKSGEPSKTADVPSLKVGNSPTNEDSNKELCEDSSSSSKEKDATNKQSTSDEEIVPHSPKTKPEVGPSSSSSTKDKTEMGDTSSAAAPKGTDSTDTPSTSTAGPSGKTLKTGGRQQARQQDSVDVLVKSIDTLMVFFKQQLKGTEET